MIYTEFYKIKEAAWINDPREGKVDQEASKSNRLCQLSHINFGILFYVKFVHFYFTIGK